MCFFLGMRGCVFFLFFRDERFCVVLFYFVVLGGF